MTDAPLSPRQDGAASIADERQQQLDREGWTPEHDDQHDDGSLIAAALAYLQPPLGSGWTGEPPVWWPWEREAWKPKDYRSNLVRAGALIAAEIDRMDRRSATPDEQSPNRKSGK